MRSWRHPCLGYNQGLPWGSCRIPWGWALLYLLRFINQSGRIIYYPILPLFLLTLIDDQGQINSYTGIVISVAATATAVFSVTIAQLGDRFYHQPVIMICLFGAGLTFILQSLVQSSWKLPSSLDQTEVNTAK